MLNRIIKNICSLFMVLFFFNLMWAGLRYLLIDDTNSYTRITMHEFYDQDNVDVLFMGASHCYRGFYTDIVDNMTGMNTFNLGSSSQPIEVTYLLMQDAIKRYNVKHIYVDLSYNIARNVDMDLSLSYIITDYMKSSIEKVAFLLKYSDDDTYINSFFIARRSADKILDKDYILDIISKKRTSEYKQFGYVDNGNEWYGGKGYVGSNIQIEDGSFIDSYENEKFDLEIPDSWVETIKSMIELCQKNDVDITFVSIPISSYRLLAYGNYDSYIEYVSKIVEEYGVEYVDFNLLRQDYWEDTSLYFRDYSHLNDMGATKFSSLFARYMQGELLTSDLLYGSIEEKYNSLPSNLYGVLYQNDPNEEDEILNEIVTNDSGGQYYRILVEINGEKILLQDWSKNKEFYIPKDYEGICYIEVLKNITEEQDNVETYSLNIKY